MSQALDGYDTPEWEAYDLAVRRAWHRFDYSTAPMQERIAERELEIQLAREAWHRAWSHKNLDHQ